MKNRILSISLALMLALSVGLIGCGGEELPEITEYSLTISSTEGGEVVTPGEGTFTYEASTVVELVATPDEGYGFREWTGDTQDIHLSILPSSTITMNADYSVTANFEEIDSDPVAIWDWYDLDTIRDNLNGSYFLMNDLDSTTAGYTEVASATADDGKGWEPIGGIVTVHGSFQGTADPFGGTLDGQGHEIRDVFINRPKEQGVGLFGSIGETGVVKNLGVADVEVLGYQYVGGLAAVNDRGLVGGCYSSGNVSGHGPVGKLVGDNRGTVNNCYSTGRMVSGGGLVGCNWGGTVSNSYSAVSAPWFLAGGGLVGWSLEGKVRNSFWDTQTSGQATSDGGTGKTTAEMKSIATFSGADWNIIAVADPSTRNPSYIWNIVDGQTYPFLSWQSV